MRILGHRGASHDFPENTLPAFLGALGQGADGIELDVMRCKTGELVVCHDEVLQRVAGVPWAVAETPWLELSQLDVGTPLGFPPARVPQLSDVLDAVPPSRWVNIELKCDLPDDGGLSVEVARLLALRGEGPRVSVSSFNPHCLLRFAAVAPSFERGLLLDPDRELEPQLSWLGAAAQRAVHPHCSHCTPARVEAWKRLGLGVVVWTVDEAAEARALEAMGADAVITNRPGALRAELAAERSAPG